MIAHAKASAVPITALGFGLDYDESLLTRVATDTGGRFLFVEEPESVVGAFLEEVLRLEKVVTRNMGLILTPGPRLQIVEVPAAPQTVRRTHSEATKTLQGR